MAIKITPTAINAYNKPVALTEATGTSSTAGTAETFETTIPAADENLFIVIKNPGLNSITASVIHPYTGLGSAETVTIGAGKLAAVRIMSKYIKKNGKVQITVTPNASETLSGTGVKLAALYHSVLCM